MARRADKGDIADIRDIIRELVMRYYEQGVTKAKTLYGVDPDLTNKIEQYLDGRSEDIYTMIENLITYIESKMDAEWDKLSREITDEAVLTNLFSRNMEEVIQRVIDDKINDVLQYELSMAEMRGAGDAVYVSELDGKWYFPHFGIDDECEACEEVRTHAPYTPREAEEIGAPLLIHPRCDHSWIFSPKGSEAEDVLAQANAKTNPMQFD